MHIDFVVHRLCLSQGIFSRFGNQEDPLAVLEVWYVRIQLVFHALAVRCLLFAAILAVSRWCERVFEVGGLEVEVCDIGIRVVVRLRPGVQVLQML